MAEPMQRRKVLMQYMKLKKIQNGVSCILNDRVRNQVNESIINNTNKLYKVSIKITKLTGVFMRKREMKTYRNREKTKKRKNKRKYNDYLNKMNDKKKRKTVR